MLDERNERLLSELKEKYGDNGEFGGGRKISPCAFSYEKKTKENIDNPGFEEEDWKEFWKLSKTYFPFHSVAGGDYYSTPDLIKKSEMRRYELCVESKLTSRFFDKTRNVLEIGYGFGGAGHYLMDEYGANYFGIDYVSSDEKDNDYIHNGLKRFYEIDKSGIPSELKNRKYDLIFSTNVFQHLTQKQRFEYIKEAHDCLGPKGVFYFDVFQHDGVTPVEDVYSANFFNVFTKIDSDEEIQNYLDDCGFDFIRKVEGRVDNRTYLVSYTCKKRKKK